MNFLIFMIFLLISLNFTQSKTFPNHPIAKPSTSWINTPEMSDFAYKTGFDVKAIVIRESLQVQNMAYACGFFWIEACDCYVFSVYILKSPNTTGLDSYLPNISSQVVWSANRNNPINYNSTLQFTSDGDLILRDADGELVWSTNTSGKSVAGLNMTETGNLVMYDVNNSIVWQSFDHPTDTLLSGQKLKPGQKLTGSISESNWSEGLYSYNVTNNEDFFYIGSESPDIYYHHKNTTFASDNNFIQLGYDGHLRRFQLDVNAAKDVLKSELNDCQYPLVCGEYGVCQNRECSCPQSSYFQPNDVRQPNLGCTQIMPLNCNATHLHSFVEVENVSYFTFSAGISNTDQNSCKKACLGNCSCKAAVFRYGPDSNSIGDCYLPSQIYTLMDISEDKLNSYNLSIFLKVQSVIQKNSSSESSSPVILGLTFGALLAIAIVLI